MPRIQFEFDAIHAHPFFGDAFDLNVIAVQLCTEVLDAQSGVDVRAWRDGHLRAVEFDPVGRLNDLNAAGCLIIRSDRLGIGRLLRLEDQPDIADLDFFAAMQGHRIMRLDPHPVDIGSIRGIKVFQKYLAVPACQRNVIA